ncbi:MAG: HD-GYP domain-containing protein [Chloroflexota bacterium]
MIEADALALPVARRPSHVANAWLRTGELLESARAGWLLCFTGLVVLALSATAALVSSPASAGATFLTAGAVAVSLVVALGLPTRPGLAPSAAGAASVAITGLYAATIFESTPTVVWLFAYIVPAVGLARGAMAGGVAGFVAAPVLHMVETGVLFEPLDPQGPFGFLILIALGAAPGYLMSVARARRLALDAQLSRAQVLLDETDRARAAEHEAKRHTVFMLARAAEARDGTTGAHIYAVRDLAAELAQATGATAEAAELIGWSAMLHDVGKLRVPDRILLKPGRLDGDEWELIKRHAAWGEELLDGGEHFELARRIARWHHENWDGSGYPDSLAGARIPFEARIVRIADVYDALRAERPYKPAWTDEQALTELRRVRGLHLDPELTDLFLRLRG